MHKDLCAPRTDHVSDPSRQLPLVSSQPSSCPGADTHPGGAKTESEDKPGPASAVGNVSGGRIFLGEEDTRAEAAAWCAQGKALSYYLARRGQNPFRCLCNVAIKHGPCDRDCGPDQRQEDGNLPPTWLHCGTQPKGQKAEGSGTGTWWLGRGQSVLGKLRVL